MNQVVRNFLYNRGGEIALSLGGVASHLNMNKSGRPLAVPRTSVLYE